MDDFGSSDGDSDCDNYEPQTKDPCYRCEKRVYPVERVDIGVVFHRRCFRCRVCGIQLTLRTFHWDQENKPDVYCQAHVTKLVGSIDTEAVGIKSALNAPKRATNNNEQVSFYFDTGSIFKAKTCSIFIICKFIFSRIKRQVQYFSCT